MCWRYGIQSNLKSVAAAFGETGLGRGAATCCAATKLEFDLSLELINTAIGILISTAINEGRNDPTKSGALL